MKGVINPIVLIGYVSHVLVIWNIIIRLFNLFLNFTSQGLYLINIMNFIDTWIRHLNSFYQFHFGYGTNCNLNILQSCLLGFICCPLLQVPIPLQELQQVRLSFLFMLHPFFFFHGNSPLTAFLYFMQLCWDCHS